MGLSRAAIRFLVREHRRKPLAGSVLTLGRQGVYADFDQLLEICRQEGVAPAQLPPGRLRTTNIPAWQGTPRERYASDSCLFQLLGIDDLQALDCSSFEGAELVWDLNLPVPEGLLARFDLVLDSGTLEHVFDVRAALINVNRMLKPGGRILHMGPCNNYANHGFYQFSPTLFLDYYRANAYADVRVFAAEETACDYEHSGWDLFQIDPARQPVAMASPRRMLVVAQAEKQADSTVEKIPVQSYYRELQQVSAPPAAAEPPAEDSAGWPQRIKQLVPLKARHLVRTYLLGDAQHTGWKRLRRGKL